MRVRFGKNYWTIRRGRDRSCPDSFAFADHVKHIIVFDEAALTTDRIRLNTYLHECLHAMFPYLDEDTVSRAGDDLTATLWRLGVRPVAGESEL